MYSSQQIFSLEKCRSYLVKSVRAASALTRNPTLSGWAFVECDQIDAIRLSFESSKDNPVYTINCSGVLFCPTSQAEFDGAGMAPAIVEEDSTVIWCQRWNQGCFVLL
jgi:hypothetical protein